MIIVMFVHDNNRIAKCQCHPLLMPISNKICVFFLGSHVVNNCWIQASLSLDSLISMFSVSNVIHKNDKDVEGPSSSSDAMGMPNSAHRDTNVSKFCWYTDTVEHGGPIVR